MGKGSFLINGSGTPRPWTLTFSCPVRAGNSADSIYSISLWPLLRWLGVKELQFTMVANKLNITTMVGDAQCMVLHSRASPNITQDQDLC